MIAPVQGGADVTSYSVTSIDRDQMKCSIKKATVKDSKSGLIDLSSWQWFLSHVLKRQEELEFWKNENTPLLLPIYEHIHNQNSIWCSHHKHSLL